MLVAQLVLERLLTTTFPEGPMRNRAVRHLYLSSAAARERRGRDAVRHLLPEAVHDFYDRPA